MHANRNDRSLGSAAKLIHRVVDLRRRVAGRREHDAAMADPRIAAEHAFQVAHATSHGKPGCEFCS
jgi:hypothetical protein